MAQISRQVGEDPQDLHHFISNSPWSARQLMYAIQRDVLQQAEFRTEAALIIDENADEKSGTVSAGAGRQHNGRTGQIDVCQVGVFLTLATAQVNLWLDGELFIPEAWFTDQMAPHRAKAGLPPDRCFQTTPGLAWQLIVRAQQQGVPFRSVSMDTLYGRSHELRQKLQDAQLEYYADVPADTHVYLCPPRIT